MFCTNKKVTYLTKRFFGTQGQGCRGNTYGQRLLKQSWFWCRWRRMVWYRVMLNGEYRETSDVRASYRFMRLPIAPIYTWSGKGSSYHNLPGTLEFWHQGSQMYVWFCILLHKTLKYTSNHIMVEYTENNNVGMK